MGTTLKARDALWAQYNEGCRQVGSPCDFIPDEAMYHALKELDHALGLDPSDVDPTCLVSFQAFKDRYK